MFEKFKADLRELLTDDTGRLSLTKTMLLGGWLFVSGYMLRLIVSHQFTPDYLIIYIAFISGQHLTSKWLDGKPGIRIGE